jgi:hypothetical protein
MKLSQLYGVNDVWVLGLEDARWLKIRNREGLSVVNTVCKRFVNFTTCLATVGFLEGHAPFRLFCFVGGIYFLLEELFCVLIEMLEVSNGRICQTVVILFHWVHWFQTTRD